MKFKGLFTALSAMSLIATPTLASAAPIATPLTQPATEQVQGDNELIGGLAFASYFILFAAVGSIFLGIYAGVENNDSDPTGPTIPNSP